MQRINVSSKSASDIETIPGYVSISDEEPFLESLRIQEVFGFTLKIYLDSLVVYAGKSIWVSCMLVLTKTVLS